MAKVKKPKLPRAWSGKVLTDEIAERLADEIESTDGFKWERRRPVGLRRADDDIVPPMTMRVPEHLQDAIRCRANQERRTVSDLGREAFEGLLEK